MQRGRESFTILGCVWIIRPTPAPYPATVGGSCSPANAKQTAFPVTPGGAMPPVKGFAKQDYAVLIVIGMSEED